MAAPWGAGWAPARALADGHALRGAWAPAGAAARTPLHSVEARAMTRMAAMHRPSTGIRRVAERARGPGGDAE